MNLAATALFPISRQYGGVPSPRPSPSGWERETRRGAGLGGVPWKIIQSDGAEFFCFILRVAAAAMKS